MTMSTSIGLHWYLRVPRSLLFNQLIRRHHHRFVSFNPEFLLEFLYLRHHELLELLAVIFFVPRDCGLVFEKDDVLK